MSEQILLKPEEYSAEELAKRRLNRGVASGTPIVEETVPEKQETEEPKKQSKTKSSPNEKPTETVETPIESFPEPQAQSEASRGESAPISVKLPMATQIAGETPHASTPMLRVKLAQVLDSLPSEVQSSVIPSDSERIQSAGKVADVLAVLGQMINIDPTLDARSELTNVENTQGDHIGSV